MAEARLDDGAPRPIGPVGPAAAASRPASVPALLECFDSPVAVVDRQRRIVAANAAYRARFSGGVSVEGRLCHEISHNSPIPCDHRGETCPMLACARSGLPERAMHCHFTPRGEECEEIQFHPMRDSAGRISTFLEFLRPVSGARTGCDDARLVGRSRPLRELLRVVERVAVTDTPVLLLGESGTGKELVAHKVHSASPRSAGPFVPLDCSGLNESLFESELFGHEKGSFTGAIQRKIGLVESARGGTLFLDEIGDIPLAQQVKLLRLLETGSFRRVGSTESQRADFRLVCATHRDLKRMIEDGRFRADLYYRISAFPVTIPPLKERIDDLPLLIEAGLDRCGGPSSCRFSDEALEMLRRYDFPGNVRELMNLVQRACLLAEDQVVRPEHLPDEILGQRHRNGNGRPAPILTLAEAEERYLAWALQQFNGSHRSLARKLGVSERTLYRRFRRIRREEGEPDPIDSPIPDD